MPFRVSRREFLAGIAALTAHMKVSPLKYQQGSAAQPLRSQNSPFRIAVINDEISQDFGHACEVASRELGMGWIELRTMWIKNVLDLNPQEITEAQRILKKNK